MGRIRIFPLLFQNGCSRSSRFLPQARRIVGSGDENALTSTWHGVMPGRRKFYAPINVKPLRGWGRPGIGGGFDSSPRPAVGSFDRFNGLSSNILLTFSCYFYNPQMPWGGAFEQKLSAQFKCPAYARPPPPPQRLNIDRCIMRWKISINSVYNTLISIPNIHTAFAVDPH